MDSVMTKTVNVPGRGPLDRSSFRYRGANYGGVCTAAKGLMLEFLKTCFENLEDGNPFKFHEDQKYSKIFIGDKLTFNLDQVDKRPAVIVSRGGIGYRKVGFDQSFERSLLQKRDDEDGRYEGSVKKTGLLNGGLVIQCYGKGQSLQAELLGESVFELITDMEDALREIGYFTCYATHVGEEIPVKQGAKVNYIMVPVQVTFSMQRSWSITPRNLRVLRNVVLAKLTANDRQMI